MFQIKLLLCFFFFCAPLFSATIHEERWQQGQTLLTFFEQNSIPSSVYYNLPSGDKELADEILSGSTFYTLYDNQNNNDQDKATLLQALIPINEESQLHIYRDKNKQYKMRAIPIVYFKQERQIALSVHRSLFNDIVDYTGDNLLASEFVQAFKNHVNFKKQIQKGDTLAIIYERKYRLGRSFGSPELKASTLFTKNKQFYVIKHSDGHYYDLKGNNLSQYLLTTPLQYKRISSKFSMGRKHPILGITRPHLGVDYAAPRHTPIKAAGKGKVIFAGTKGGYGKTIILQHDDGFKTLYAHLQNIAKGIKVGMTIPQGKKIGTVGSTGLSTGPHLHFGLYKNGNAINPQKYLKIAKSPLKGKEKEDFLILAQNYAQKLTITLTQKDSQPIPKINQSHIIYLSNNQHNP